MPTRLDRATLLARFDSIRHFARGGKRAPHKPLLLLYALARLKHDRQREVRFKEAEAALRPLIRSYGPWGTEPRVSYPFSRLVNDRLWHLPDAETVVDAKGDVREALTSERDAAGFAPEVLAAFEREAELIDVVAVQLLERHFAPGLHEEILEAVGHQLGSALIMLQALWHLARDGCTWRRLPPTFPPHTTVWSRLQRWQRLAVLDRALAVLVACRRLARGRRRRPTAALIDTQSVKTGPRRGPRGYDPAKKVPRRRSRAASACCWSTPRATRSASGSSRPTRTGTGRCAPWRPISPVAPRSC